MERTREKKRERQKKEKRREKERKREGEGVPLPDVTLDTPLDLQPLVDV